MNPSFHLVEKFVAIKEQVERMEASLLEAEQPDREELVRPAERDIGEFVDGI